MGWAYEGSRPTVVDGRSFQTIGNEVLCRHAATGDLSLRHMWGGSAGHNGTAAPIEDTGRLTEGTLRLGEEPNLGELGGFPIQGTRVTGFVARVSVTQVFENPYERRTRGRRLRAPRACRRGIRSAPLS